MENQKKYLVVWTDKRDYSSNLYDVYAALVEPDLSNFDVYPIDTSYGIIEEYPCCAFVPVNGQFIIAWRNYPGGQQAIISANTIDLFGNIGSEKTISYIPSIDNRHTEMAFGNQFALVVWLRKEVLSGVRIDPSLNVQDPEDLIINLSTNYQTYPKAAFDGEKYFVVWQDNRKALQSPLGKGERGIYFLKLEPTGRVSNPGLVVIDEIERWETHPDIAFTLNKFLVAYGVHGTQDLIGVYGVPIEEDGSVGQEFLIDDRYNEITSIYPSVSPSGTHFLVTYHINIDPIYPSNLHLMSAVINAQNLTIERYIYLGPTGMNIPLSSPASASNGESFLVVWDYGGIGIKGAIIDPSGLVSGPFYISSTISQEPDVAFDGKNYLVVWRIGDGREIKGRFVDPTGNIVGEIFTIATSPYVGALREPSVSFDGWEYLVSFRDKTDNALKVLPVHPDGTILGTKPKIVENTHLSQRRVSLTQGPGHQVLAVYEGLFEDPMRAFGRFLEFFEVDDEYALAFNSNVNMQRDVITDSIHLVYTRGEIYHRKGGILKNPVLGSERILWDPAFEVNTASMGNVSIALDYFGNPHITWSDGSNLLYRRQLEGVWSPIYTLLTVPFPELILGPTITLSQTLILEEEVVHIIYSTHTWLPEPSFSLEEIYFPVSNPNQTTFIPIFGLFPAEVSHFYPSVDYIGSLHLAFKYMNEIHYATRELPYGDWNIYWNVFGPWGTNSTTPMTEVYGDKVYVVWTKLWEDGQYEVVKAERSIEWPPEIWMTDNFSRTPTSPPLQDPALYQAPVNAWGTFTVWVDQGSGSNAADIYTREPPDYTILRNLTPSLGNALFPEVFTKFLPIETQVGLVWQQEETNQTYPIYNIFSQIFRFIPHNFPFYTVKGGDTVPSIHITYRDSFITTWQYSVDIGYDSISARFILDPRFKYDLEITVYHEGNGEWREFLYFDDKPHRLIKYNANEPKTIKIHIPKGFYNKDNLLNAKLKRQKGDYAVFTKMLVYRYETEQGQILADKGGAQTLDNGITFSPLKIYPNPVKDKITIDFGTSLTKETGISLYDVSGRVVKKLLIPANTRSFPLNLSEKRLPKGIYFLKIESKDAFYRIVKIQ